MFCGNLSGLSTVLYCLCTGSDPQFYVKYYLRPYFCGLGASMWVLGVVCDEHFRW